MKFTQSSGPQDRDADFVRAGAVEMNVNMSQELFYTEIYTKFRATRPRRRFCASLRSRNERQHVTKPILHGNLQLEHPDQAPAFTPTVRTPQCGHTAWEKKCRRKGLTGEVFRLDLGSRGQLVASNCLQSKHPTTRCRLPP